MAKLRPSLSGSNSSTVKSHNLRTILYMLLRHDYISRARMAEMTGLSTTTITNLITELLDQGIVAEEGNEANHRRGAGRPRTALRLVSEARYAMGVHIGVGKVQVAVTDLRANIISHQALTFPVDETGQRVLSKTADLIRQTVNESQIRPKHILGVGVGASGLVNPDTGVNLIAPNLGWYNLSLRDWFADQLGYPVYVDNNVRAMALGEVMFGAARNVRVAAFVYARIGVGAGFVVDGQLYRGSGAGAGEIGHTTLVPDGGQPCRCGNTGCLETLVSEPAIMNRAYHLAEQDEAGLLAGYLRQEKSPTVEQVFAAARAGDRPTQQMLAEIANYMGIALANLVNILNPELILLGGVFAQGQDVLLPLVEETVRRRAFANLGERVRLRPASLGRRAGVVGGAALALTHFFYQQAAPLTYPSFEVVI